MIDADRPAQHATVQQSSQDCGDYREFIDNKLWVSRRDALTILATNNSVLRRIRDKGLVAIRQLPGSSPKFFKPDLEALLIASVETSKVAGAPSRYGRQIDG